jgi:MFS family permease
MSNSQSGVLGSVLFVGLFLGSLVGAFYIDRIGRKNSILMATIV